MIDRWNNAQIILKCNIGFSQLSEKEKVVKLMTGMLEIEKDHKVLGEFISFFVF